MRRATTVIAPILLLAACHHPSQPADEAVPVGIDAAPPPPYVPPPNSQVVISGPPVAEESAAPAAAAPAPAPPPAAAPADAAAPAPAGTTVVETVATDPPFRGELTPYGVWMERPGYGWVWVPSSMPPDWRPYTWGHWVWVDECGWTWVADEPFGPVCYHYGRWYWDVGIGWAWVPGTVWGPSWVVWRTGGGFVGWAPMPPVVEVGFVSSHPAWVETHVAATTWVFVDQPHFCAPTLRGTVVVTSRNTEIIRSTRNITNVTVVKGRVVDRSLDVHTVERFGGPAVPRARFVKEQERPTLVERRGPQETRHAFAMPAPPPRSRVQEPRQQRPPPQEKHEKHEKHDGDGRGRE